MNIFHILAIAVAIWGSLGHCDQPPYQVSLYVSLHPKGSPVHLCNGAIVQSRLILTTASCVHYKFTSKSPGVAIPPSMLRVICGTSTAFVDELSLNVKDILVADNFNYTTGDNDLALLRLSTKLPLDERNDMSWITLEDADNFEGPCVGNYYVRNSMSTAPNYIQSEELPLLDSEICRENSPYPRAREDDICSLYMLPLGFNCHAFETLLPHNGDRGTGLVCENKLIGLLSTILPVDDKDELDCSDKPIKAFYTNLAPHLEWIFSIVSHEDLEMYETGDFVSSLPYSGENNAIEETLIPEPGTMSPLTSGKGQSSTESSFGHSAAQRHVYGAFLPVIMAISLSTQSLVFV